MDSYLKELQTNHRKNKGITYGIYEKTKLIAFIGLEISEYGIYIYELLRMINLEDAVWEKFLCKPVLITHLN